MKVQIWVAAMEKQPPLSIKIIRDDNVDQPDDMVIQVMECLNEPGLDSPAIKHSIYKLPFFMRRTHSEAFNQAFDPQVVSFGPYHHGKQHLSPMEREKAKVFDSLKTGGLPVEAIVSCVSTILYDLLESYDRLEEEWTQHPGKFLKLMIVDGCFMLQLFCNCPTSLSNMKMDIRLDTLLLENQLPLKLLHKLYSIAGPIFISQQPKATYFISPFFFFFFFFFHLYTSKCTLELKSVVCNWLGISTNNLVQEFLHVLDMYRASLVCTHVDWTNWNQKKELSGAECQVIPPATELREAGMRFKTSGTTSLGDVKYDKKNVMAFEKLNPLCPS
ncbi:uncharacterized protein LOC111498069 [Cucurbita maxima]|uniref:Uncharacterized protein LOC111498069 n=1 Tax=Cucurbita maxima TaxID=3661 RepID=A0A6J1KTE2_CUCMA|nr:uncharacterized protein LOC111498069 [Cucurbita maxima]